MAKLPAEGPCRAGSEVPCRLSLHDHRNRKTGPEFPLAVLRCLTHERGFTVYPPGYVPYGRQRIAPVAPDGSAIQVEQSADELEAYAATAFGAAIDAAAGRAWSREGTGPWWSTQGRWLVRLVSWVGVAVELDEHVRGALAAMLGVAQLVLREQARQIGAAAGYRSRGRAVVAVLERLGRDAGVADRLVAAGAIVGLWPAALRWHPDAKQLRAVPFRGGPARASPAG